jgi:hypothetical protein
MDEIWAEIDDFPGYSVSSLGNVVNNQSGHVLTRSVNQNQVLYVGLARDRQKCQRSVAVLVANAFLPEPKESHFDTPTHLDGDRMNCYADNLVWRPRWFAIRFHRERLDPPFPNWRQAIRVVETGEVFPTPEECARKYGLLAKDIHLAIMNEDFVFPTWFEFEWVK